MRIYIHVFRAQLHVTSKYKILCTFCKSTQNRVTIKDNYSLPIPYGNQVAPMSNLWEFQNLKSNRLNFHFTGLNEMRHLEVVMAAIKIICSQTCCNMSWFISLYRCGFQHLIAMSHDYSVLFPGRQSNVLLL